MENLVKQTEIAGMQSAGRVLPIWRGEYSDSAFYEQTDIVLYNNSSYIAKRDTTGNPPPEPTINSNAYWQLVAKGIIDADVSDATVALTYESENREELQSGETTDTLFSKIKRWYSEFATVTFSGKYSDLSGTPGVVSKSADGLVQKGNGQINKVWKTDADGNPAWRDDANTQTITGIKGNAETAYRTGNVNLTPANIGAVATSKVLSTKEQINANTDTANVAGATAVKAMVSEINSNINKHYIAETMDPENTGFQTLLEYVMSLHGNGVRHAIFSSVNFPDLPAQHWGFSIDSVSVGSAINVRAYKHLSVDEYYFRAIGVDGNWISGWQKFVFESNIININGTGLTSTTAIPWNSIHIQNSGTNAVVFFSNWTGESCFPENYGSGIILPCTDVVQKRILYIGQSGKIYTGFFNVSDKNNITWHTTTIT